MQLVTNEKVLENAKSGGNASGKTGYVLILSKAT